MDYLECLIRIAGPERLGLCPLSGGRGRWIAYARGHKNPAYSARTKNDAVGSAEDRTKVHMGFAAHDIPCSGYMYHDICTPLHS